MTNPLQRNNYRGHPGEGPVAQSERRQDSRWLEFYIGVVDAITPQQVKHCAPSERDEAFAWLTS
jgi:hypothetical protein